MARCSPLWPTLTPRGSRQPRPSGCLTLLRRSETCWTLVLWVSTVSKDETAAALILGATRVSRFGWNQRAKRYVLRSSGRFIAQAAIRHELDRILDESTDRVRLLSRKLVAHQISLADWQRGMATEVKHLHITFAAAAHGGWDHTTAADWGRVSGRIKAQYQYLDRFARQIYARTVPLGEGLVARASMYMEAARGTYEAERGLMEAAGGATEELSVLAISDHCSECMQMAAQGWQPIGTLTPIGMRQCLSRCRCTFIYRSAPSAGSAASLFIE